MMTDSLYSKYDNDEGSITAWVTVPKAERAWVRVPKGSGSGSRKGLGQGPERVWVRVPKGPGSRFRKGPTFNIFWFLHSKILTRKFQNYA